MTKATPLKTPNKIRNGVETLQTRACSRWSHISFFLQTPSRPVFSSGNPAFIFILAYSLSVFSF